VIIAVLSNYLSHKFLANDERILELTELE
jgi:hypothetical protein